MSIWTRIIEVLTALRSGESLSSIFERLNSPPEQSVGFTIAVIGLGAKMAKADGLVTRDEVAAFREVFHIAAEDEENAGRVFDLARKDVSGFEDYARRIHRMFRGENEDALVDLIEGLFHIAMADGEYHPNEELFLERVAEIFEIEPRCFNQVRLRFVPNAEPDPRDILGIGPEATLDEARDAWRALVRETHPDAMIARGVPEEAVKIAERRMIAVNRAWEAVSEGRA